MTQSGPHGDEHGAQPVLVLWESYRERDPHGRWRDDLSTLEAVRLLNEVRCFGRIAFQLVGRPLRRSDLGVLIEHGARIGLAMRVAPGPDPLREDVVAQLRDSGLVRLILDAGARPPAALLAEIRLARTYGLGVHVTSQVSAALLSSLRPRADELMTAGAHVWTLSFPLDPDGTLRGAQLDAALRWVVQELAGLPLRVEIAGAPQFRRVQAECGCRAEGITLAPREGYELLYVAGDGQVQPSPDLPMALGNVRHDDVGEVFRDAPVLAALRDPAQLRGKCRFCEYVKECGGSRARAQAMVNDWLAPDPACAHRPASAVAQAEAVAAGAGQGT